MNKTPQTQERVNKQKDSKELTKVISRKKNNKRKAMPKKNLYKETSQNQFKVLNSIQEKMNPNEVIADEAGEEEMHPIDSDQDERDTGNTNKGKEKALEDTEMQQVETEETLEENAIEESLQGVDLASIAEEWKLKGINSISEQHLQKIEGAYILGRIKAQSPPTNTRKYNLKRHIIQHPSGRTQPQKIKQKARTKDHQSAPSRTGSQANK